MDEFSHNTFTNLKGPIRVLAMDLSKHGGVLHCLACDSTKQISEIYIPDSLQTGWPKCCGYNMEWITEKELKQSAKFVEAKKQ